MVKRYKQEVRRKKNVQYTLETMFDLVIKDMQVTRYNFSLSDYKD